MKPALGIPAFLIVVLASAALQDCSRTPGNAQHKRIAGIVFQEDQFFRLVLFGMRASASRNGAELLEANSGGKPDREIDLINTYIASNVDAIVISPLSARGSVTALGRARERGIAVITYNTNVEGDVAAAFVESDQAALGRSTGAAAREYIEQRLGGKANVGILAFRSQAPEVSTLRTEGFRAEISKLPGVHIVAEQDAWLAEQAVKKSGDIISAHADLDILWGANEGATVGEVMAVKNAGRAGRIAVFGTDAGDQVAGFLLSDDGILQAVTAQQPYEIGSRAVDSAVLILTGERVERRLSLPGVLLSRSDPEGVMKFAAGLKELSR